jgi:hypothetical protein
MTSDALEQMFSTYKYLKDSIKVTSRSINKSIDQLHGNTIFSTERTDRITEKIKSIVSELDDIMTLSLFASFERELRTSIAKLKSLRQNSIGRWTINGIIDAFGDKIEADIRDATKEIYKYRNWVAHGRNKAELPLMRTDPKITFIVLDKFVTQASKVVMENGLE